MDFPPSLLLVTLRSDPCTQNHAQSCTCEHLKTIVSYFAFTLMPTVALLLSPSAFTASYKQQTKNYKIDNNITNVWCYHRAWQIIEEEPTTPAFKIFHLLYYEGMQCFNLLSSKWYKLMLKVYWFDSEMFGVFWKMVAEVVIYMYEKWSQLGFDCKLYCTCIYTCI